MFYEMITGLNNSLSTETRICFTDSTPKIYLKDSSSEDFNDFGHIITTKKENKLTSSLYINVNSEQIPFLSTFSLFVNDNLQASNIVAPEILLKNFDNNNTTFSLTIGNDVIFDHSKVKCINFRAETVNISSFSFTASSKINNLTLSLQENADVYDIQNLTITKDLLFLQNVHTPLTIQEYYFKNSNGDTLSGVGDKGKPIFFNQGKPQAINVQETSFAAEDAQFKLLNSFEDYDIGFIQIPSKGVSTEQVSSLKLTNTPFLGNIVCLLSSTGNCEITENEIKYRIPSGVVQPQTFTFLSKREINWIKINYNSDIPYWNQLQIKTDKISTTIQKENKRIECTLNESLTMQLMGNERTQSVTQLAQEEACTDSSGLCVGDVRLYWYSGPEPTLVAGFSNQTSDTEKYGKFSSDPFKFKTISNFEIYLPVLEKDCIVVKKPDGILWVPEIKLESYARVVLQSYSSAKSYYTNSITSADAARASKSEWRGGILLHYKPGQSGSTHIPTRENYQKSFGGVFAVFTKEPIQDKTINREAFETVQYVSGELKSPGNESFSCTYTITKDGEEVNKNINFLIDVKRTTVFGKTYYTWKRCYFNADTEVWVVPIYFWKSDSFNS